MSDSTSPPSSPAWSSGTKLIIGLTFVAILAAFLIYFRSIIGPLLLAVILAYVLHPLAAILSQKTHLNWRWSVNIVFFVFVLILLAILTVSGFAIVQQMQSLVGVITTFTVNLPDFVEQISSQIYSIGPYQFGLNQSELQPAVNQVLDTLQPVLGRFGSVLSSFATGALVTLGWGMFVVVISYFLLAQTGQVTDEMIDIDIPGYNDDIRRINSEFRRIWNVFLRGQVVIFILAIILYSILLAVLGVRYTLGIAILAGIARFIPYVGPFIVWIVTALVAFFQSSNYFGLEPWVYAIMVVGTCLILDAILDNLIVPRFHGDTLGLHPAAVLVAALIAARLIGFVGLVLAAPVLASMVLISRYFISKMLDQDPWPSNDEESQGAGLTWVDFVNKLWNRRKTNAYSEEPTAELSQPEKDN
ncbi:MAG: AI-2E family transporter [Chloroflexota bacterium]|nr:MAG: AI-2E family transporter [Chloroflexota bacterium]